MLLKNEVGTTFGHHTSSEFTVGGDQFQLVLPRASRGVNHRNVESRMPGNLHVRFGGRLRHRG